MWTVPMAKQTILLSVIAVTLPLLLQFFSLSNVSRSLLPLRLDKLLQDKAQPIHLTTTTSPRVTILSYDPFIAHIADFVTPLERDHLVQMSIPFLSRSTVLYANGSQMESAARTSSTAYLPREDPVITSIARRAADFQGFLPIADIDIQITSYQQGQQYRPHYDWFTEPNRTTNRLSTFFVILEADCNNCGTQFPNVQVDWSQKDPKWCGFVDCGQNILTTRNIIGGALFWRNLDSAGEGRRDMLHAGLPARNGTKIGLNIWTQVELDRLEANTEESTTLRP